MEMGPKTNSESTKIHQIYKTLLQFPTYLTEIATHFTTRNVTIKSATRMPRQRTKAQTTAEIVARVGMRNID